MAEDISESDSSDSTSYWNEELLDVIRRKPGKSKAISEEDKIERMKECLMEKAQIDAVDKNRNTALHVAVKKGYSKIVQFLVENGAKTDIRNLENQTALTLAESRGTKDILKALRGMTDRGSHLASQQMASNSQATLAIHPTASNPLDSRNMLKDDRGSSKRKASADNEDSGNGTKRQLCSVKDAQGESGFGKYSQSTDNIIGNKTGVQQQTSSFGGSNTYTVAHGIKNSLHSYIYQVRLLMLFVNRGLQDGFSFRLATEMKKAGKFGDLVLLYKVKPKSGNETESETVYRFLRAIHEQDETKKISVDDLLTEKDEDFSLRNYFISYRKIKKDSEFNGSKLKDFIIYTNIDIDHDGLGSKNIYLRQVQEPDDYLDIGSIRKQSARYKFTIGNHSDLRKVLMKTGDIYRLAKILVEHVLGSKFITLKDDLFRRYHIALAKEVLDVKNKSFFSDFTTGTNLSDKRKKFREIIFSTASELIARKKGRKTTADTVWNKLTKNSMTFSSNFGIALSTDSIVEPIWEFSDELVKLINNADEDNFVKVDGKVYKKSSRPGTRSYIFAQNIDKLAGHVLIMKDEKIKFRPQFFSDPKLPGNLDKLRKYLKLRLSEKYNDLDKYQFEMPSGFTCIEEKLLYEQPGLPEDDVESVDIGEFFDNLIFAVNQPNEVELGDLITSKIGADERFNLPNADLVSTYFEKEMLNWCKGKEKEKRGEKRYYSDSDGQRFFASAVLKVDSLRTSNLDLACYAEELKGYNIEFKDENEVLKNFLTSDSGDGLESALNLNAAGGTLPTAIRVQQAIQHVDTYKKTDSMMFLHLSMSRTPYLKTRVIPAFESLQGPHLLVLDCEPIPKQVLQGIYSVLRKIMSETMEEMKKKLVKMNGKKLILITQDNEPTPNQPGELFENCCETRDDASFKHLTTDSQLKLARKEVIRFQGDQQLTSFEKLLDISGDNDKAMRELGGLIDTGTFMKLLRHEEIRIGSNLQELEEVKKYYIPRTIVREVIIKDNIFESQLEFDEFAISTLEKIAPKFRGLVLKRGREAEEFEKLYQASRKNVHWLKYVSGKFIWHRSRGDTTFLMKYRDVSQSLSSNDYDILEKGLISSTEYELVDLDYGRKVVIISGSAGTGKTTMLTSLAKHIKRKNPRHWVIRIDLNDFIKVLDQEMQGTQLQRQSFDGSNSDRAIKFFVRRLSKLETKLEKKVLKIMMRNPSKVVLLFDGFDKISPENTSMVIDLLQGLKIGVAKLFIATRPHMQALLEKELGILSYTMQPLTMENQYDFLINFWKAGLGLDDVEHRIEQRLNTYAQTLIESLVESIDATAREVVSLPGQLRIIAKLCQGGGDGQVRKGPSETCEEYLRSENDEPYLRVKLKIADLYRSFVDNEFYIYDTEKKSDDSSNIGVQDNSEESREILFKRHQKLAVHSLFGVENPDDSSEILTHPHLLNQREMRDINAYITKIIEGRERTGIITQVVNGRSQFIHRTFTEYFAATFIFDTLLKQADRDPIVRKFLVQEILAQPEYKVIRAFLNGLLSKVSQQSDDQHAGSAVSEAWKVDFVKYSCQGDSIFHTAAQEGHYEIMKFFLNRIDQHKIRRELISTRVGNDLRTVLHIVTDNQEWDELKWLIQNGGAAVVSLIGDGRTLLHAAASRNNLNIVKWLVEKGALVDAPDKHGKTSLSEAVQSGQLDVLKWLVDEINVDVNRQYDKGVTLLHYAAQSGKIPVLKWLIEEKDADVKATTYEGNSVLLCAARFKHWDVVRLLADSYDIDVGAESRSGRTVLYYAVEGDSEDTIKWLVKDKDIHVSPTYADGSSILHHAISAGSINVVKWLIRENNADPNETSNEGYTPLTEALIVGEITIFNWLVNYGEADVNAKDKRGMTSLHWAAKLHTEIIGILVTDYGADIDARDNDGKRPIDFYGDGPSRKFLEPGPQ